MLQNTKKQTVLASAVSTAVAILLLGYSSYGWLVMSRDVTAVMKDITITAPDNLEISATGPDSGYNQIVTVDMKQLVYEEIQSSSDTVKFDKDTDSFSLLPASSYDGLEIWKTDRANSATGAAECGYDEYDNATGDAGRIKWRDSTHSFEGYYIDVPLWIRTASGADIEIAIITKAAESLTGNYSQITTSEGNTNVVNVVRCAFLDADKTAISTPSAQNIIADTTYDSLIFCHTNNSVPRVIKDTDGDDLSNYITPCSFLTETNINSNKIKICTAPAYNDGYQPVKINVRIWIEGEDSACVANIGKSVFDVKLVFGEKK